MDYEEKRGISFFGTFMIVYYLFTFIGMIGIFIYTRKSDTFTFTTDVFSVFTYAFFITAFAFVLGFKFGFALGNSLWQKLVVSFVTIGLLTDGLVLLNNKFPILTKIWNIVTESGTVSFIIAIALQIVMLVMSVRYIRKVR